MTRYIRIPIETNSQTLAQQVYDYIQARVPQWTPNELNLDTWIIEGESAVAADNRELASNVADNIWRSFGATVMGFPPVDSTPSTVLSTWVMVDNAGYTVPAGTQVGIRNTVGDLITFETVVDVVVPAGTTTATNVTLRSVDNGAATSGLGANGVTATLLDVLTFVSTVTLTASTSGGVDAETDDAYMDRLVLHMRLMSMRPILPIDFAIMARDAAPSVYRVVAIDGYNPVGGTYNNERMVAIAGMDSAGNNLSSTVKTAIDSLLQANREVNFVVNVIDPTRNTIDVNFTAHAMVGYTNADVSARAVAALQSYLSPASWGSSPNDALAWTENLTLRFSEVGQALSNVEGLDYWTVLQMRKSPAAFAAADIALTGPAAVTVPGVITPTMV